MTYKEIDEIVGRLLNSSVLANSDIERRCYFTLERENPKVFTGYGERNGLMYLGDIDNTYYVDVNIKPKAENEDEKNGSVVMVFREDDDDLIRIHFKFSDFKEIHMRYFMSLVVEYLELEDRWGAKVDEFNKGVMSQDFLRNNQIESILK